MRRNELPHRLLRREPSTMSESSMNEMISPTSCPFSKSSPRVLNVPN